MKDALNVRTFLKGLDKAKECSERDSIHLDRKQIAMLYELISNKEIPSCTSDEVLEMTHYVGALCSSIHKHEEKWTSETWGYGNMKLYNELRNIPSATKRRLF